MSRANFANSQKYIVPEEKKKVGISFGFIFIQEIKFLKKKTTTICQNFVDGDVAGEIWLACWVKLCATKCKGSDGHAHALPFILYRDRNQ